MMESLLFFSIIGSLTGLVAGLFGIGGGVIMVPAILFALVHIGADASVSMHVAVGTSLSVIALTGLSSAIAHWQKGAVETKVFLRMAPGLLLGAVLGAVVADFMSAGLLRTFFGIFIIFVALKMYLGAGRAHRLVTPSATLMALAGALIGGFSALFGVGGGVLSVPWLTRLGLVMQTAVGTSAACGVPIAFLGTGAFMVTGYSVDVLGSNVGYIYWPATVGLVCFSVPSARIGVRMAHRLPQAFLKKLFAGLLFTVGVLLIF